MTTSNTTASTRSSSSSTASINSAANLMGAEANLQFFRLAEIYTSSTLDNHHHRTITDYNVPDQISANDIPRIELSLQDIIEFNDRRSSQYDNTDRDVNDPNADGVELAPPDRANNNPSMSTSTSMDYDNEFGDRRMSSCSSANNSSESYDHRAADRIATKVTQLITPSSIEIDASSAISERIGSPKPAKKEKKKINKKKVAKKRLRIGKKIDIESQRMAHIAVERNRRRQMNHHLGTLRSLMPASYIQRGDQASVIGGAIEFIKELEQVLQSLEMQKDQRIPRGLENLAPGVLVMGSDQYLEPATNGGDIGEGSSAAVVEVKLVGSGSSAVIKVLAQKKAHHRLLDVVTVVEEGLRLKIMQINITRIRDSVLYHLYVEVQDAAKLRTAIDIAEAFKRVFMLDSR